MGIPSFYKVSTTIEIEIRNWKIKNKIEYGQLIKLGLTLLCSLMA